MSDLSEMPIERRDELIAQVWAFLLERGYRIVAPGSQDCGHPAGICCARCAGLLPERANRHDGGAA